MKIRNSGGAGQAWRARFLGAIPNTTAWPNVPLALSQGTFDGLVSSNESLVSAKLWDAGVKYALEDHQFIAEYIPLVSQVFWDKLSPDLQKMMTRSVGAERPDLPRQHGGGADQGAHHAAGARHQVLRSDARSRAPRSAS